jgi:hypothetical protein
MNIGPGERNQKAKARHLFSSSGLSSKEQM